MKLSKKIPAPGIYWAILNRYVNDPARQKYLTLVRIYNNNSCSSFSFSFCEEDTLNINDFYFGSEFKIPKI